MAKKVVTAEVFAEVMKISRLTVTKLLRQKRLPGYKFCGRWFITLETVEAIQGGSLRIGAGGHEASTIPGEGEG